MEPEIQSRTAESETPSIPDAAAEPIAAELAETVAMPAGNEVATGEKDTDFVTPQAVQREVREFVRTHERRRKQFPRALLVGGLTGLVAVAFRSALQYVEDLRNHLIVSLHGHWWGAGVMVALAAAGASAAVMLVQHVAPEASGSGIPHLKAVLHRLKAMHWERILPVKFFGGVLGIGAGLALGREGPTIQMGGAVAEMVSEWLKVSTRERQTLIAAGAGAGLAAAFNAPLAGMVFVLEEVQRDFTPTVFAAALVASVISDVVARLLLGQNPVFHMMEYPTPDISTLPAFLLLGILAGMMGVVFNRSLLGSLNFFGKISWWPKGVAGAMVGVIVGLVGWFLPGAVGGGYPLLGQIFPGNLSAAALVAFFFLRFGLTMISYGCGAPGGIFAPLLVLGAILGEMMGYVADHMFPHFPAVNVTAFAIVGMGAYFSGIVRAPLTGIVLILEMTLNYGLMLPLLVACLSAYAVADWLGDRPVYEALLERDLLRGQDNPELHDTLLLELTVQPDSPFEGRRIRDLGLPQGCIIVTIHRGLEEEVPGGDTELEAGDRITAVVAPHAANGVALLREGTEPEHR